MNGIRLRSLRGLVSSWSHVHCTQHHHEIVGLAEGPHAFVRVKDMPYAAAATGLAEAPVPTPVEPGKQEEHDQEAATVFLVNMIWKYLLLMKLHKSGHLSLT